MLEAGTGAAGEDSEDCFLISRVPAMLTVRAWPVPLWEDAARARQGLAESWEETGNLGIEIGPGIPVVPRIAMPIW